MFLIPRAILPEDWGRLWKCHNRYGNLVHGLESQEVDWLNKFIEDHMHNLVFDSDKKYGDPIQVPNACVVVVTGFVL